MCTILTMFWKSLSFQRVMTPIPITLTQTGKAIKREHRNVLSRGCLLSFNLLSYKGSNWWENSFWNHLQTWNKYCSNIRKAFLDVNCIESDCYNPKLRFSTREMWYIVILFHCYYPITLLKVTFLSNFFNTLPVGNYNCLYA